MKQEIMEKLLNAEELSKDELIFVARNLADNNKVVTPYKHDETSTLDACGITKEDADELNTLFADKWLDQKNSSSASMSEMIEHLELLMLSNEKFLRMTIMQCIAAAKNRPDPLSDILGKLLGGKKE